MVVTIVNLRLVSHKPATIFHYLMNDMFCSLDPCILHVNMVWQYVTYADSQIDFEATREIHNK
jgi:hypothetical protein